MPRSPQCPEASQLKKLAVADFTPDEMEPLLEHLQDCDACLSQVQTLAPKDTLVTALARAKALADNPHDPLLTGVIARLTKLGETAEPPAKLNFACGQCGKKLKVKAELAGKKVKCPGCGQTVPVPRGEAAGPPGSDDRTLLPTSPKSALDVSDERTVLPAGGDTRTGLSGVRDGKKPHGDATQAAALARDAMDFLAPAQEPDELGRLGQYRVLKKLGAGGMGMVLLAEDTLLHRQVALKVMLPQYAASDQARERFLREARAAAKVEHDNVVAILQVGEENDVPFLAMPFLKGQPLDAVLENKQKLPLPKALQIAAEMAEGLAAAHAMGLIHRDIKPGNVWLEKRMKDEGGRMKEKPSDSSLILPPSSFRVKLLDFGLARSEDDTKLTQSGAVIGTPAFMAPEQARGGVLDARADLFSLGCVLYVMLTGERPFKGENTISLLTALALENPAAPQILNPDVPKEVSDFTMWLLQKNPDDRPASAAEVATELTALRGDQAPAETRLDTRTKRLRPTRAPAKQPRAWMGRAAAIFAILLGLGGAAFAALYFGGIILVPTPRGTLVIEIDDPNIEVVVKQGGVKLFDPTTKRQLDLKVGDYEIDIADAKEGWKFSTKQFTITRDGATKVKIWLDRAVAANPLSNGVNLDPAKIPAEERYPGQPKELVAVLGEHRAWRDAAHTRSGLSYTSDGKWLAVWSDRTSLLCLWDAVNLRWKHDLGTMNVTSLAMDHGNTMAVGLPGQVRLWNLAKEKPEPFPFELPMPGYGVRSVSLSPNGKLLAAVAYTHDAAVWDISGEEPEKKPFPKKAVSVAFAPDGKTVITGGEDGVIRLLDVSAEKVKEVSASDKPPEKDHEVVKLVLSQDGKILASTHRYRGISDVVRLWRVKGQTLEGWEKPPDFGNVALAFDLQGKTLVLGPPTTSGSPQMILVDVSSPALKSRQLWTHLQRLEAAAFAPDGKTLATVGLDGFVKLWDVTGKVPKERVVRASGHSGKVLSLAFSPDGKTLASGGHDRTVRLWDLSGAAPRENAVQKEHSGPVFYLRYAPDGKSLISGARPILEVGEGTDSYLWQLTPDGPKGRKMFENMGELKFATFRPDGKLGLVGLDDAGKLRLWDVANESVKERATPPTPWIKGRANPSIGKIALAANDKVLAFNIARGRDLPERLVRIWDLSSAEVKERTAVENKDELQLLAFAPDCNTLASGTGHVHIWDIAKAAGKLNLSALGNEVYITCGVFSPDGKTLYCAYVNNMLVAWDVLNGSKNQEWQMPLPIHSLAQSRDGRYLAAGNGNGTIYILQVAKDPVAAIKPVEIKPEEKPPAPSASPLDRLDPAQISADNRRPWLPKETVAVVGDLKGRMPDAMHGLAVGPDGKWLLCFGGRALIDVYDAATLRFHCELKPPAGRKSHGVEFLSGNVVCAFGSLWDLSGTEPSRLADLTPLDPIAVAAEPKAARLAAQFADGKIHVWDWVDGKLKELGVANHPTTFHLLRFLPDGNTLVSADGGGSLRLWDLKEPAPRLITDLKDAIQADQTSLAVSPNGKLLATYERSKSGWPNSVILWDLTNPKQPQQRKLPVKGLAYSRALAFSPDSTLLAVLATSSNGVGGVQLWPVAGAANVPKIELAVPQYDLRSVAFAADGKTFFVGAEHWGTGSLHVLDFDGGKLTNRWQPHDPVLGPVFSPDGQTLATSLPAENSWWDLTSSTPSELKLPNHFRNFSGFSPQGLFFSSEGALSEWDGKKIRLIASHGDGPHAVSVDGGTAVFAYGDGGSIEIANIIGGKWQKEAYFSVPVQSLFLRSDGKALAASNLWDTGKPSTHLFQQGGGGWKQTWKGTRAVALSQRGDRFAVAEADGLGILDISGPEPRELAKVPVRGASSMSFAPAGGIIAVVTRQLYGSRIDVHVVVIDIDSGVRLHTWQFPADVSVSFAPDGRHLAVGLQHGATLILRLPATKGKS